MGMAEDLKMSKEREKAKHRDELINDLITRLVKECGMDSASALAFVTWAAGYLAGAGYNGPDRIDVLSTLQEAYTNGVAKGIEDLAKADADKAKAKAKAEEKANLNGDLFANPAAPLTPTPEQEAIDLMNMQDMTTGAKQASGAGLRAFLGLYGGKNDATSSYRCGVAAGMIERRNKEMADLVAALKNNHDLQTVYPDPRSAVVSAWAAEDAGTPIALHDTIAKLPTVVLAEVAAAPASFGNWTPRRRDMVLAALAYRAVRDQTMGAAMRAAQPPTREEAMKKITDAELAGFVAMMAGMSKGDREAIERESKRREALKRDAARAMQPKSKPAVE